MSLNKFFCSWSGGKDSCLSLYKSLETKKIICLVTAMIETEEVSRSHGLTQAVLRAQADALDIPLLIFNTSWAEYEDNYFNILKHIKKKHALRGGIFGDIDVDEHRDWCLDLCHKLEIEASHPLWKREREKVLKEFLDLGFKAKIVAFDERKGSRHYLGKDLNLDLIDEFKSKNIDICGEQGEYHTVVYDGPIFKQPLRLKHGDIVLKNGYWFLNF